MRIEPMPSLLVSILLGLFSLPALGKDLLTGTIAVGGSDTQPFVLSGENRENVIGGQIRLGERAFDITKVSRMGLIGASRLSSPQQGEFAIFSSSFSEQTATGQPWVAGKRYHACDQPYNSFLAVYRIEGEAALQALGDTPYPLLAEDIDKSSDSTVFCFFSKPPA